MKNWVYILPLLLIASFLEGGRDLDVVMKSPASTRSGVWDEFWKTSNTPAIIELGKGLLPVSIPGPSDAWANGKTHTVDFTFSAPKGKYDFVIDFFESHNVAPPNFDLLLNGRKISSFQVKNGSGAPPPYSDINENLRAIVKLETDRRDNVISLVNISGSWAAPARVILAKGETVNLAKALYRQVTGRKRIIFGISLILAFLFFLRLQSEGWRRATATTALFALSCIVTFAAAELVFRLCLLKFPHTRSLSTPEEARDEEFKGKHYSYMTMIQPSPYPDIIYRLKPNIDGYFSGLPLQTNSSHMRGPEVQMEKGKETIRIAGLGDSVVMGWGVAYEETSLYLASKALAEYTGRQVEPLNFGCPSYNLSVEVASYQRFARRYRPDIVVLVLVWNDFGMPGLMLEPVRPWSVNISYLFQQSRRRLALYWPDAKLEKEEFISSRHHDAMEHKTESQLTEDEKWQKKIIQHYTKVTGEEAIRAYLSDFAGMLKEDGAIGLVVYNPVSFTAKSPDTYEPWGPKVAMAAESLGLASLDMGSVYEEYLVKNGHKKMSDAFWVRPEDFHPNAIGHKLMAEAIIGKLLSDKTFASRYRKSGIPAPH